jgi:choline dehydrogenase-like flavoprotein
LPKNTAWPLTKLLSSDAMIIDSRTIENHKTVEADVCIIGAGVAGITLAQELAGADFKVCLLESGGTGPDNATQALSWGPNVGLPYYPLDVARASAMGGSGHRWNIDLQDGSFGVRLHPLDPHDFEEREWVPDSGWPFSKAGIDPFYNRAQHVCKVGAYSYDVGDWETADATPRLPFASDRVQTTIFQFMRRTVYIEFYRRLIDAASNITTFTHGSATELRTDESAGTVTGICVRTLGGNGFFIKAHLVVLAAGAMETPRLLLISNRTQTCGLGNGNDLVGRYFMEHPHLWSGRFIPAQDSIAGRTALYRLHWAKETPIMGKLTISAAAQRAERILNYCVSIHPEPYRVRGDIAPDWPVVSWPLLQAGNYKSNRQPESVLSSLRREARDTLSRVYRKFKKPGIYFTLNHMSEQLPNRDSRVMLCAEKDAFDRNRIQLNWQVKPLDVRTIIRSQQILDEELRKAGLGHLVIELKDQSAPPDLHGGWHHMGTTRMNLDPAKGVVDQNCRVHGISNLFVAGPSVFPTGGYANPVLTIVALSIRLADHIKATMQGE